MKYVDAVVEFGEVPNEISLCVSISGCQIRCPECHSKYLWEDSGIELTSEVLENLVAKNPGISCICIMGGKEEELVDLLSTVRISEKIKIAWYTGLDRVPGSKLLSFLDYLKVGHYDFKFGPLTSKTTNQKFYRVTGQNLEDCTSLFWKTNQI